jgi:cell wall-associated NlpC family hydrolase
LRQGYIVGISALLLASSFAVARADQSSVSRPFAHVQTLTPDVAELPLGAVQPGQVTQPSVGAYQFSDTPGFAGPVEAPPSIATRAHVIRLHSSRYVRRFANSVVARTSRLANQLTRDALRFIGTPYVFGGTSRYGFDCSGFVQHVFALMGVPIPRTADAQYYAGKRATGGPRPGDLVFFQTYEAGPSHVGIYLGHDHFVHASSSRGVMVSSLSESYWSSRYLGAKRLLATR